MNKLLLISTILLFGGCFDDKQEVQKEINLKEKLDSKEKKQVKLISIKELKAEYSELNSVEYLEEYITNVIMQGSTGLGFPAGDMPPATTFSQDDAKEIAKFVVTLSNRQPTSKPSSNGQLYFSGTCGGCHGADAKGGDGSFPDLTKSKFVGIKKREKELKYQIDKSSQTALTPPADSTI